MRRERERSARCRAPAARRRRCSPLTRSPWRRRRCCARHRARARLLQQLGVRRQALTATPSISSSSSRRGGYRSRRLVLIAARFPAEWLATASRSCSSAVAVAALRARAHPRRRPPGSGARRWLDLGPVGFQPSELAKLAVVLMLAASWLGATSGRSPASGRSSCRCCWCRSRSCSSSPSPISARRSSSSWSRRR